jgi:group II intron reverse transcriptase/maturase
MPDQTTVPTSLQGIANKAASQPDYRFRNLYGLLNEEMLLDSWPLIRQDAALGVDRVSAQDYEQDLAVNVQDLVTRLKEKRYHAKLVRRCYIPKADGQLRPLGIPATEDKLLQLSVKRILEAIYEQDFLRCSYGYRPHVGARDAVDKLTVKLQFGAYHYVVEADIQGFFDNLDHDWLLKMLAERVDDQALLHLIAKWLKAGVLDTDGKVLHPTTGSPQGGIISPVLANIYLHYALDLWFHKVVRPQCHGEACLIRYADDFVCAFEYEEEAQRFYGALGARLAKFGLTLAAAKTRIIPFSQGDHLGQTSFDFLGFEFRWGHDRAGKPQVKRRTARRKLISALKNFKVWCQENHHRRLKDLFARLNAKLRGYYQYYGIRGNYLSLQQFFQGALRYLFRWLNQRSQRTSYTWPGFQELIKQFGIVKPKLTAQPKTRTARSAA